MTNIPFARRCKIEAKHRTGLRALETHERGAQAATINTKQLFIRRGEKREDKLYVGSLSVRVSQTRRPLTSSAARGGGAVVMLTNLSPSPPLLSPGLPLLLHSAPPRAAQGALCDGGGTGRSSSCRPRRAGQ